MEMMKFLCALFMVWALQSCIPEDKNQTSKPKEEVCQVYLKNIKKLQNQLIEVEKNADRLENVMYVLTQNYLLIDEKIRLVQKIRNQPGQKKLLKRTASEIILFFKNSQLLLDSVEKEIQVSKVPQSSLLPIIDAVRNYITTQENLFIEVHGSIQTISEQIGDLKKELENQKVELRKKEKRRRSEAKWLSEEEGNRPQKKIFYMIGTKEELSRAKVVQKKGGFLGMGSTLQLSDKLENMYFQTGDFKIVKEISLGNTQKVNLVSIHPKNAYLVIDTPGEKFLKITDPEKFWSASNYLVVEVD
jgi:hypothetical protein